MTTSRISESVGATVYFSRRMLVILTLLFFAPWATIALIAFRGAETTPSLRNSSSAKATTTPGSATRATLPSNSISSTTTIGTTTSTTISSDVTESKVGPWGQMQYVPIVLEVPDEYLFLSQLDDKLEKWTFTGMSREAVLSFIQSCGVTNDQLQQFRSSTWVDNATASTVEASDPLILSLSPEARSKLYGHLQVDPANSAVIDPYWFREGRVDFRLRGSDLSPESTSLLKSLLYRGHDDILLFADIRPALRSIKDPAEQKRFVKAATRKRSLMARVIITADTDTTALAAYWGSDGREKDLVPLFDSLKYNVQAGIESPGKLNIVPLLPPFARERLYNHAYATQGVSGRKQDCFWTAFNFFAGYPDDEVNDMAYLSKILERDYYKISEPTKLGDVILITDQSGDAIHAANYIADDIVFTKNGINFTQPWILVPMKDMLETYKIKSTATKVFYFRRK